MVRGRAHGLGDSRVACCGDDQNQWSEYCWSEIDWFVRDYSYLYCYCCCINPLNDIYFLLPKEKKKIWKRWIYNAVWLISESIYATITLFHNLNSGLDHDQIYPNSFPIMHLHLSSFLREQPFLSSYPVRRMYQGILMLFLFYTVTLSQTGELIPAEYF